MGLERLVEEIEARSKKEFDELQTRTESEKKRLLEERLAKLQKLKEGVERATEQEAQRERSLRLARAKVDARKLLFEARERRMLSGLDQGRAALAEFTKDPDYDELLERLYRFSTSELGGKIRVFGREEDATALKALAGKNFLVSPVPILGGFVAESADGHRRLNVTFDELLRLRENPVRELLST